MDQNKLELIIDAKGDGRTAQHFRNACEVKDLFSHFADERGYGEVRCAVVDSTVVNKQDRLFDLRFTAPHLVQSMEIMHEFMCEVMRQLPEERQTFGWTADIYKIYGLNGSNVCHLNFKR